MVIRAADDILEKWLELTGSDREEAMPLFFHEMVHSGAETLSNQLSGTPVAQAGPSGVVKACFGASEGGNTAKLVGRVSGRVVIPGGSHPARQESANSLDFDSQDFIFSGSVNPNEELDLEVISAAASTTVIGIRV